MPPSASDANPKFQWAKSSHFHETIGNVAYEFATLTGYKSQFPPPPAPPRFVVEKGDDNLAVVIDASPQGGLSEALLPSRSDANDPQRS